MRLYRCLCIVLSAGALGVLLAALVPSHALQGRGIGGSGAAMFGGSPSRNLVNLVEKKIADDFSVKKGKEKNVKWKVRLGTYAYGGPVISGGRIFVGTNNKAPRDPAIKGDRGVMMCFEEATGKFLWQAVHNKLPSGDMDYPEQGVASAPVVEGERLYYVSNRCELVCADVKGDGKGKAKFLWTLDMRKELGVYPCQLANSSPLIVGDLVYTLTGNGWDVTREVLPSPRAPSFIAVNKKTGKLAWKSNLPGKKIIRGQWSNPTAATVKGKTQILFAGGDCYLYSLDAKTGDLNWKFFLDSKKAKPFKPGGAGEQGFPIATPVVHENRAYIAIGQEPEDGPGVGHLWCIDITKTPKNKNKDVSPVNDNFDPKAAVNKDSALIWHVGGPLSPQEKAKLKKDDPREFAFSRTISTVAVHEGLVYAAELTGYLNCFDARTGKKYWEYDFNEGTWCSPYYVDGKVYIGTDSGNLFIFQAGQKLMKPKKIEMDYAIRVPVLAARGVLYVNTGYYLYAIAPGK